MRFFGIILGICLGINKYFHIKKIIMKSIKLKVFFLAVSFFSFSVIFAQDTTNKPKPDTTKLPPKHDSTSMINTHSSGSFLSSNVDAINSSLTKNRDRVEAKIEALIDERLFKTSI